MRSQNIKVKDLGSSVGSTSHKKQVAENVGRVSCFLFLLLSFLALNLVTNSVYAETGDESTNTEDAASIPSPQSETFTSSVRIAFGEPVGTSSLTPVSVDGASALYTIRATVDVANSGGYTVYLGSKKSELTGKNYGVTINTVTSSTSYDALPLNTWGYSATEGTAASPTLQAMPANTRGSKIGENASKNIKSDSKTFTLSFAAHIGNDKPADTYENEITLSVVSSPLEIAGLTSIANMQDMTTEICAASEMGETKQLIDLRDNKKYWVKKMPDNQCWMVQNLDLDLGTSWPAASLSDYNTASTTYKPVTTASTATTSSVSDVNTSTRSWSFGDYVITSPETASDCGSKKNSYGNCSSQFASVAGKTAATTASFYQDNAKKTVVGNYYDAHYLVGNQYQWNTATAGTGGVITSGQASGSICPKNWKLPISNSSAAGSFGGLLSAGNIGSDVAKLTGDGYFFVRGGIINQNNYLLGNAGLSGHYWSATPNTVDTKSYELAFSGTNVVTGSDSWDRMNGRFVRCVAR